MSNESPQPDIETKKHKQALELFSISEDEKEALRQRVKEVDGLIRVFIHPIAQLKGGGEIKNQKRVFEIVDRTLFSEKSPPIIVFENSDGISDWIQTFDTEKGLPNDIYLVPTVHDYPYPIVTGKPEPAERDENGQIYDKDFVYIEEGFKNFVEFIDSLSVEKVLVGGTSLKIIQGHLTQCVGNFIQFMKTYSDMDVKLSLGTAPINRSDIQNSHPELL